MPACWPSLFVLRGRGSRARRRAKTRRAINTHGSAIWRYHQRVTVQRPAGSADEPVTHQRASLEHPRRRAHGHLRTEWSRCLKEFYGRGPTRAKSYYEDDLVVCVLRGGFSRVEQTLLEGGRGTAVIQQRMEFQEVMREPLRRGHRGGDRASGDRVHEREPAAPRSDVRGLHPRPHRPRRRATSSGASHAFRAAEPGSGPRTTSALRLALCCAAEGITAVGPKGPASRADFRRCSSEPTEVRVPEVSSDIRSVAAGRCAACPDAEARR